MTEQETAHTSQFTYRGRFSLAATARPAEE